MSVFLLCEQAIGLLRGKRLILNDTSRNYLEALNYEGLTGQHAQDEAVVCALHFGRVRDRLLQLYPFKFARKNASVSNGILPSDCLSVLCVLQDSKPIEYEVVGGKLNVSGTCEVHYTANITDTESWDGVFSDVFVYSLAVEIAPAVTGEAQISQVLEQKAQELIHRAYQIGAIQPVTQISLKESIYNRAIGLSRGIRTLSTASTAGVEQGIDNAGIPEWRVRAEIQACERAAASVRDRLLGQYAWRFARRVITLTETTGSTRGWTYGYTLPEDCLRLLAVVSTDGEVVEYEEIRGKVFTNCTSPTLRYTARDSTMNNWPGEFVDVYVYQLAEEIVLATTNDANTIQLLGQKSQQLIHEAERSGAIKAETRLLPKDEIFRRAIDLIHGQRTLSPTGNTSAEQGLDFTGYVTYREEQELRACRNAYETVRDKLLSIYAWEFAKSTGNLASTSKKSGWNYAYTLPSDCMKVLVVLSGDTPVEYEVSGNVVQCNSTGSMTVRYIRKVTNTAEFCAEFREVLSLSLAIEVCLAVTGNAESGQLLEAKRQQELRQAIQNGVIKSEVRIPLKDELYNRAIILSRGNRTVSPVSQASEEQGLDYTGAFDWRTSAERQACERAGASVRDRLFELYAWKFARRNAELSSTQAGISGWKYGYVLPEDCMRVLAVVSSEDEVVEHEVVGQRMYCNEAQASVRYTARITEAENWAGIFRELYVFLLAIDVVYATFGKNDVIQSLEQKTLQLVQSAYQTGAIDDNTELPMSDNLYGRAIQLAHGSETEGENVTTRNSRERAVCKRSAPYVRDRLLQLYPWIFARKTAAINGSLPADCVTLLSVLKDGKPINLEDLAEGDEVIYTAKVEDFTDWDAVFTDAFVYMLAAEIVRAVKGDVQAGQVLEQQAQEYIRHGYEIGAIRAETRIVLKEELYNRAIGLVRGQRVTSGTSENAYAYGLDHTGIPNHRTEAETQACERASVKVRDRLLQLYPWVFARESKELIAGAGISGWKCGYELPDDCLVVLTALAEVSTDDGGECVCEREETSGVQLEPVDYEVAGHRIYTDEKPVTIRYTARKVDAEEWPSSFCDVYVYMLAEEIYTATTPMQEGTATIFQAWRARIAEIIQQATAMKVIQKETHLPVKDELCSRAVGLLYGLSEGNYEEAMKAARRSYKYVRDGLLESYAWVFARRTVYPPQRTHNVAGWRYTYELPEDCVKVWSVIANNRRYDFKDNVYCEDNSAPNDTVELLEYEVSGKELYTNRSPVYVRYTTSGVRPPNWSRGFREVLTYKLASEVAISLLMDKNTVQVLEEKAASLIQTCQENGTIRVETRLKPQRETYAISDYSTAFMAYSGVEHGRCRAY